MESNLKDVTLTLKGTLHAQPVRWRLPCSSNGTGNCLTCCSPTGILPVHVFKSTFNASRELLPSVREGYKTQSQNICSARSDICCMKQETGFHRKLEQTSPQKVLGVFCLFISRVLLLSLLRKSEQPSLRLLGTRCRSQHRHKAHLPGSQPTHIPTTQR